MRDSSNETNTTTDGVTFPTGEVASPPTGETLIIRREEPLQGQSTVGSMQARQATVFGTVSTSNNSAVVARSGVGAREAVAVSGAIVNTPIQADANVGVVGGADPVDGTTHDKTATTAIQADGGDAVVGCVSFADKTICDKTATPGNKGADVDVAAGLDLSLIHI